MPGLKNLSTAQRGVLWKSFTSGKIEGAPKDAIENAVADLTQWTADQDKEKAKAEEAQKKAQAEVNSATVD